MRLRAIVSLLSFLSISAIGASLQANSGRYALILQDQPVTTHFASRAEVQSPAAATYRTGILARQRAVQSALKASHFKVTGSVSDVLNAVFVAGPKDRVAELQSLPGVKAVVPLRVRKLKTNLAVAAMNGPAAWNQLGGPDNAGKGMKIAILDTGIEVSNPAFQDSSLTAPAGFPICSGGNFDCSQFTNNKVIVARSYVAMMAAGSAPDPSLDSRPDDFTPRDHVGHGTATASVAAGASNSSTVTFRGMAPKAFIGNYKVTGSPGVNDGAPDDVTIQAAEDALHDGMDVISYSFGGSALTGPLDAGAICGNPSGVPCDLVAVTFNNLTQQGIIVVAAAGNEGTGDSSGFNTIDSPGDAPNVIAVGAITNAHSFSPLVSVAGESNMQSIAANPSDSYALGAATAPLRDVVATGDDGYACSPIPVGYLNGVIALIARGPQGNACTFSDKANNAINAGAVGVIFYDYDDSLTVFPSGLSGVIYPGVLVSHTDGLSLKSYIAAHPEHTVTINLNAIEVPDPASSTYPNHVASFSSQGPGADGGLKPDLVATGTDMYMSAQTYDPYGILYSSNGYAVANGTSFATPIVSGAAALVKQMHSDYTPDQVKSALVNTASSDIRGGSVVQYNGAGKLDANAAVGSTVTVVPSTISWGIIGSGAVSKSTTLTVQNHGSSAAALTIATGNATVTATPNTLNLGAGAQTVTIAAGGNVSSPGVYAGTVAITGTGVSVNVPYMFSVGSGTPANMISLSGDGFDATVGQDIPEGILAVKVVDSNGIPVANQALTWTPGDGKTPGKGKIVGSDNATDANGVAAAQVNVSPTPGTDSYTVCVGTCPNQKGIQHTFSGKARSLPNVPDATYVQNAGSFDNTIAPGSYIAIKGTNLADSIQTAYTPNLPVAMNYTFVSFDVPSAGISLPGHLTYISPTQVNVHVPWELQGQSSAKMKVSIWYSNGNVVNVPLVSYAPAIFPVGTSSAAQHFPSYQLISSTSPATAGESIILYANGLGPVNNQPASGGPASATNLSTTTTTPIVTIGGKQANVQWSGLTPGLAGLYQINLQVPSGLSSGNQPIKITIGGKDSQTLNLAVQ